VIIARFLVLLDAPDAQPLAHEDGVDLAFEDFLRGVVITRQVTRFVQIGARRFDRFAQLRIELGDGWHARHSPYARTLVCRSNQCCVEINARPGASYGQDELDAASSDARIDQVERDSLGALGTDMPPTTKAVRRSTISLTSFAI